MKGWEQFLGLSDLKAHYLRFSIEILGRGRVWKAAQKSGSFTNFVSGTSLAMHVTIGNLHPAKLA
jgi:hypothetical protein